MKFNVDGIDEIKQIMDTEVLGKLESGEIVNYIDVGEGEQFLIITETVPTLKKIIFLDIPNGIIKISTLPSPKIIHGGKDAGIIQ